ncbi:MAG TPA: hypothetical protein VLV25_03105 [Steroidobacteraceae bacterium]|nr:hypothetical protein [Steroidobacteraceae bacterium]
MSRRSLIAIAALSGGAVLVPRAACAQAGPPYLTNDPGTPGNGNWEINLASMTTRVEGVTQWQIPQIDLNFGLGDRIQLTYEVPYVVQSASGEPQASGWSNAFPGIKWRFLDQGEEGWQMSVFPQYETPGTTRAQSKGIAEQGSRLLLPIEVSKSVGPFDLDLEAGYYFAHRGPEERILGFVAGHGFTPRLELDVELYNDHAMGALPNYTALDVGGRYRLGRGFVLLFMAGRSIANSSGEIDFMSYLGVQILLSDYGLHLEKEGSE